MKPSDLIEKALASGNYQDCSELSSAQLMASDKTAFMCCAVGTSSKNARLVAKTQRHIEDALYPYRTLSGHLKNVLGVHPTWNQRLEYWAEFLVLLKKQNL